MKNDIWNNEIDEIIKLLENMRKIPNGKREGLIIHVLLKAGTEVYANSMMTGVSEIYALGALTAFSRKTEATLVDSINNFDDRGPDSEH